MPDTDDLFNDISGEITKQKLKWTGDYGQRTISYIPFTKTEDQGNGLRTEVENQKTYLAVRSFAQAVQEAVGDKVAITDGNLMSEFKGLDPIVQKTILKTTVQKTPIIIQSGVNTWKPLKPTDVVNIEGHGHPLRDFIAPTVDLDNDPSALKPGDILKRMNQSLGNNMRTIKLGNCGSGGEFFKAFQIVAGVRKELHEDTKIQAYKGDSVAYLSKDDSLLQLRTKGKRFIVNEKDPEYAKIERDLQKYDNDAMLNEGIAENRELELRQEYPNVGGAIFENIVRLDPVRSAANFEEIEAVKKKMVLQDQKNDLTLNYRGKDNRVETKVKTVREALALHKNAPQGKELGLEQQPQGFTRNTRIR